MAPSQRRIRCESRLEGDGCIVVAQTERPDGDFSPGSGSISGSGLDSGGLDSGGGLFKRRQQIAPVPWVWCEQVHGARVAVVGQSGAVRPSAVPEVDALITDQANIGLSITTADCAPIAVWTSDGAVAAIHAGWRGLAGGIVGQTISELVSRRPAGGKSAAGESAAGELSAFVGPHICAGCYEFSPEDAAELCAQWGDDVLRSSESSRGESSRCLDLRLVIERALAQAGVGHVEYLDSCSSCEAERWFSHRARSETQRNAMVVWWEK